MVKYKKLLLSIALLAGVYCAFGTAFAFASGEKAYAFGMFIGTVSLAVHIIYNR